jgi:beta-glucanase (GH16 family)
VHRIRHDLAQRTHAAGGLRQRPLVAVALVAAAALAVGAPAAAAAPTSLDVLSWSDEFDGSGLDSTRWAHRASGPRHDGVLTPDAVSVGGGVLTIKTYTEGGTHYSGMISTHRRGSEGFEQAYGYFEARIKFNSRPGQWSSFWLQSRTIGNPIGDPATAGVEMDVVEHRARCVNAPAPTPAATCSPTNDVSARSQQALIWDGYGPESRSTVKLTEPLPGLGNDSWHTWALRWTPTELTFSYDDTVTWTVTRPISRQAQYLILSSEVGEFFAGAIPAGGYGPRASTTTSMQVDYVRAYTPATPPANSAPPVTTGTSEVGETLSCSSGSWSGNPAPSLGYEWLRDDAAIPGAISPTYVLQIEDASHELGCRVSASNAAGSDSVEANTLLVRNRPLATLAPGARDVAPALGSSPLVAAAAAPPPGDPLRTPSAAAALERQLHDRVPARELPRYDERHGAAAVAVDRADASSAEAFDNDRQGHPRHRATTTLAASSRDNQASTARAQAHGRATARARRRRRPQCPHADARRRTQALSTVPVFRRALLPRALRCASRAVRDPQPRVLLSRGSSSARQGLASCRMSSRGAVSRTGARTAPLVRSDSAISGTADSRKVYLSARSLLDRGTLTELGLVLDDGRADDEYMPLRIERLKDVPRTMDRHPEP